VQFSLRSLLIFMLAAGVFCWAAYLLNRPFVTVARINCGQGRHVELLRPNKFCDYASPIHFRFTGMKPRAVPPSFAMWGCGDPPDLIVMPVSRGDLVALANTRFPDEIFVLIDFKTGAYWPESWNREVTPQAESMLAVLRQRDSNIWLERTYDSRLTKPRKY